MGADYLLDSDICIFAMKKRSAALLTRMDECAGRCALSIISHAELCYGRAKSSRSAEAQDNLDALLETFPVLPLPSKAAAHYGVIRAHLEKSGTPIGANDLWIAAHALSANLTLVTNNEREFRRVPGLKVESWAT
jgi:tRNA(fMet)-specific endonuclease VapC